MTGQQNKFIMLALMQLIFSPASLKIRHKFLKQNNTLFSDTHNGCPMMQPVGLQIVGCDDAEMSSWETTSLQQNITTAQPLPPRRTIKVPNPPRRRRPNLRPLTSPMPNTTQSVTENMTLANIDSDLGGRNESGNVLARLDLVIFVPAAVLIIGGAIITVTCIVRRRRRTTLEVTYRKRKVSGDSTTPLTGATSSTPYQVPLFEDVESVGAIELDRLSDNVVFQRMTTRGVKSD